MAKQQQDGTIIFTSRSGNQATIRIIQSTSAPAIVVDVTWSRAMTESDRRQCDAWFADANKHLGKIQSSVIEDDNERRIVHAHALTHGEAPKNMTAEVKTLHQHDDWKRG